MVSRRQIYEHYLSKAEKALSERIEHLSNKRQMSEKQARRDATCRRYEAVVRKYKRRIKALEAMDLVNADVEKRRAERQASENQ